MEAGLSVIWCQGMFASGSTWLFNAAMQVAAAVAPGASVQSRFVTDARDLDGLEDGATHVVKSHHLEPAVRAAAMRLARAIFVTVRDPRDAVVSLMQHQRYRLPVAVAHVERSAAFSALMADDPRAVLLHYERRFMDDPATLDRIAQALGGTLAAEDRARIFAATRREKVEAFIAGLDAMPGTVRDIRSGDLYETRTQWHRHHAGRDGRSDRWVSMLLPAHRVVVENRMRPWMDRFGYLPACRISSVTYSGGRAR
jgi:hypothetical protein